MITQLQGKPSDILKEFVDGKYEMVYATETPIRRFVDVNTNIEYSLSDEVNYYLDECEFIWGMMADDTARWSGDSW